VQGARRVTSTGLLYAPRKENTSFSRGKRSLPEKKRPSDNRYSTMAVSPRKRREGKSSNKKDPLQTKTSKTGGHRLSRAGRITIKSDRGTKETPRPSGSRNERRDRRAQRSLVPILNLISGLVDRGQLTSKPIGKKGKDSGQSLLPERGSAPRVIVVSKPASKQEDPGKALNDQEIRHKTEPKRQQEKIRREG